MQSPVGPPKFAEVDSKSRSEDGELCRGTIAAIVLATVVCLTGLSGLVTAILRKSRQNEMNASVGRGGESPPCDETGDVY